jgi:hypothetical protein
MERKEINFRMPGAYKSPSVDTSVFNGMFDNSDNATSAVVDQTPTAAAMRALSNTNVTSLRDRGFEVAGPTVGGISNSYHSNNTELSSEQPTKGWDTKDINENNPFRTTAGTQAGHARTPSLPGTVKTRMATTATEAVAAGASVIAAAKRRIHANDDSKGMGENDNNEGILLVSNQSTILSANPDTGDIRGVRVIEQHSYAYDPHFNPLDATTLTGTRPTGTDVLPKMNPDPMELPIGDSDRHPLNVDVPASMESHSPTIGHREVPSRNLTGKNLTAKVG